MVCDLCTVFETIEPFQELNRPVMIQFSEGGSAFAARRFNLFRFEKRYLQKMNKLEQHHLESHFVNFARVTE